MYLDEPYTFLLGLIGVGIGLIRRYFLPKSIQQEKLENLVSKNGILNSIYKKDLSDILSLVVVFAKKSKNTELERWAKLELHGWFSENGMLETEIVPEYRSVSIQHYDRFNCSLLITQKKLNFINETRIRNGIREIEGEMSKNYDVIYAYDPNFIETLKNSLNVNVIKYGFTVSSARSIIEKVKLLVVYKLSSL